MKEKIDMISKIFWMVVATAILLTYYFSHEIPMIQVYVSGHVDTSSLP